VFVFRNTAGDGRDGSMPYAYAKAFMNDAAWVDDGSRDARVTAARSRAGAESSPRRLFARGTMADARRLRFPCPENAAD